MIFSVNERREVLQELVVVFIHHALTVYILICKLVKFRQISVFLAPVEVFLRRSTRVSVRTHVVQDLVEIRLVLRVILRQLHAVGVARVLVSRVIRVFADPHHVRDDRVDAALVIRDNHADVRVRHQLANVCVGNAHADRAAVVPVSLCVLQLHGRIVVERFVRPHVIPVRVESGRNAALHHGRHQTHVDLHAGQAELFDKQRLFCVRMSRQLLCTQLGGHLHIVKHHARHVIAEALRANTAYCVGFLHAPVSLAQNVVEILHVAEGCLRPCGALLRIVDLEQLRVLLFHGAEAVACKEIGSLHELSRARVFADVFRRFVLRRELSIGSQNFVDVGEIQLGIRERVDAGAAAFLCSVPAIVEVIDLRAGPGRSQTADKIVVQVCECVGHICLAETLRIHKAHFAGSLKAVFSDNVVDANEVLSSEIHVVCHAAPHELVEHRVERSALFAHEREVQIHGVLAILLHDRKQRFSVRPVYHRRVAPRAERSILSLILPADTVDVVELVSDVIRVLARDAFSLLRPFEPLVQIFSSVLVVCAKRKDSAALAVARSDHFSVGVRYLPGVVEVCFAVPRLCLRRVHQRIVPELLQLHHAVEHGSRLVVRRAVALECGAQFLHEVADPVADLLGEAAVLVGKPLHGLGVAQHHLARIGHDLVHRAVHRQLAGRVVVDLLLGKALDAVDALEHVVRHEFLQRLVLATVLLDEVCQLVRHRLQDGRLANVHVVLPGVDVQIDRAVAVCAVHAEILAALVGLRFKEHNVHAGRLGHLAGNVTNLMLSGANVKVVQYLAGHSKVETTLNIYTHLIERSPEANLGTVLQAFPSTETPEKISPKISQNASADA